MFGSVRAARDETGADTAIVFVPLAAVLGATIEAIEAGCRLVVATADELPVADTIDQAAARANGTAFVGPNSPGLISPGKAKLDSCPSFCYREGNVGVMAQRLAVMRSAKRLTMAASVSRRRSASVAIR